MADAAVFPGNEIADPPRGRLGQVPGWLRGLLVLEVLLLGCLVLVYAGVRDGQPEVIRAGRRYLDAWMGAGGAAVLLLGGLSMVAAAWNGRRGSRGLTVLLAAVTVLAGLGFLGMKAVEYDARWRRGLFWAEPYHRAVKRQLRRQRLAMAVAPAASPRAFVADAGRGRTLYLETCAACHGASAMGLPKLGLPLATSRFVAAQGDDALLAFLKAGRGPSDPVNTTGVAMPPRGGNPTLTDEKLRDIMAYLRELQKRTPPGAAPSGAAAAQGAPHEPAAASMSAAAEPLVIHRCVVPPAAEGPAGLSKAYLASHMTVRRIVDQRQARLDGFFTICLALLGAHALCVLVGLVLAAWLFLRGVRRPLPREDSGLLRGAVLQWVVAAGAWLVLLPLLYLP